MRFGGLLWRYVFGTDTHGDVGSALLLGGLNVCTDGSAGGSQRTGHGTSDAEFHVRAEADHDTRPGAPTGRAEDTDGR